MTKLLIAVTLVRGDRKRDKNMRKHILIFFAVISTGEGSVYAPHPMGDEKFCFETYPERLGNRKPKISFSPEENENLKEAVSLCKKEDGTIDWEQGKEKMGGKRTARQYRDRYTNYLTPGFRKGPWTKEEDKLLLDLYNKYGPKWAKTKKCFTNRTVNNIKNRFYELQREFEKDLLAENTKRSQELQKGDSPINSEGESDEDALSTPVDSNLSSEILSWTPPSVPPLPPPAFNNKPGADSLREEKEKYMQWLRPFVKSEEEVQEFARIAYPE